MGTWSGIVNDLTGAFGTAGVAAAVSGVVVLLAVLAALVLHRRRSTDGTSAEPDEEPVADTPPPIRRPLYADPLLLDDLLAHAETRDYGRSLRTTMDELTGATAETRTLNKVIAGLESRGMLVDLAERPDADLAHGSAVRLRGRLEELAVSEVAELLELSMPVLAHAGHQGGNGHRSTSGEVPHAEWATGPRVLRLTPAEGDRRFLLVLHPDGMRDPVRRSLTHGDDVTVLGVAEEVLGRRERLHIDDYLTPYLSRDVQARVRDTDLVDAARSVARLAGRDLKKRDLAFDGPGARVSVAAIYR